MLWIIYFKTNSLHINLVIINIILSLLFKLQTIEYYVTWEYNIIYMVRPIVNLLAIKLVTQAIDYFGTILTSQRKFGRCDAFSDIIFCIINAHLLKKGV